MGCARARLRTNSIFETEDAAPFLPAKLLYSLPLSKAALESTGPLYNTNPETAVSSGPFILTEWTPDQQVVAERNETYAGTLQVPVQKIIWKLTALSSYFTLYETDEIDFMENPAPAELQLALEDEEMSKQIYSGVGDFRTFYLFFDVTNPPFDKLEVRQAISHVIDRDAIQSQILGPFGSPAYSWLAPGFPASDREGLAEYPELRPRRRARSCWRRPATRTARASRSRSSGCADENPLNQTVANAVASMITQNLGIEIEVSNKDDELFTMAMNAKPTEILFGYVSYGMDFLDPSNMLGVWHSGGPPPVGQRGFRHRSLDAAAGFLGDPAERHRDVQGGRAHPGRPTSRASSSTTRLRPN